MTGNIVRRMQLENGTAPTDREEQKQLDGITSALTPGELALKSPEYRRQLRDVLRAGLEVLDKAVSHVNERARQALSLRERGWFVFPVKSPDEPEQKKPGKEPAIKWRTAVSTPESIEWWWRNRPARNIGIDCGRSDLVVLDEDAAGELERLSADHGVTIPATYTVITSRGRQLYFEANPRYPIRNKVHLEGYAIDVRGDGGLVVAAGSVHESGHVYAAVDPHAPAAPLPDEIAKLVVESAPERKTSDADRFLMGTDWQQEVNLAAGEGRNNAFYRYSSALIGLGLSDTEIRRW
ncbi:hypothetical protein GS508_22485 [Rhodococcus hoagii]|nr:hypothetical protein [Prescottella equi]